MFHFYTPENVKKPEFIITTENLNIFLMTYPQIVTLIEVTPIRSTSQVIKKIF